MSELGTPGRVLVTEEALQERISAIARQISSDYDGRELLCELL